MPGGSTILRLPSTAASQRRVEGWRETVSPLWSIEVDGDETECFASRSDVFHLGACILGNTAASAHRTERPLSLVARMGVDHVLVQLRLSGRAIVRAGSGEHELTAGDILLLDLSQVLSTRSTDYEAITLALPRRLFASAIRDADELHGHMIRGATPLGALVASHMRMLSAQAERFSPREASAAVDATAALIAACAQASSSGCDRSADAARPAALLVLRRFIEENLASPQLDAGWLAQRFGLSRSTLYRLFKPMDGVASYIRRRRLARAYLDLSAAGHKRPTSVQEIAYRWRFDSPTHFVQAFKQEFGCTPSSVRGLSLPPIAADGVVESRKEAGLFDWVMKLGA